jgi:hypothetical protein
VIRSLVSLCAAAGPDRLDGDMTVDSEAQGDPILGPGKAQGEQHRRQRQKVPGRVLDYADPHGRAVSAV